MFLPFQDSCAKMLLFRGADKECLNFAGQTAYQVQQIVFRHVTRVTRGTCAASHFQRAGRYYNPAKYSCHTDRPFLTLTSDIQFRHQSPHNPPPTLSCLFSSKHWKKTSLPSYSLSTPISEWQEQNSRFSSKLFPISFKTVLVSRIWCWNSKFPNYQKSSL